MLNAGAGGLIKTDLTVILIKNQPHHQTISTSDSTSANQAIEIARPDPQRGLAIAFLKQKRGRGNPRGPWPDKVRCRPPVGGALASHGLTPQYSRRDAA